MKPLAHVSDEMYVAIPGALSDWESVETGDVTILQSSAAGAIYGRLPAGQYRVTLAKDGFGSKTAQVELTADAEPISFRLMSDNIVGYAWPKWVRAGETSEFRVHSPEEYQISLWRYGQTKEFVSIVTWIDEHGPQANRQVLPDGDFTQTGLGWNRVGYASAPTVVAPERSGMYYFHARTRSGKLFTFPWIVAPKTPKASIAVLAGTNTWNAYNNFGGRSNYVNATELPERPVVCSRQDLQRYQDATPFQTWKFPDSEYSPLSFDRPEPGNHIFDENPDPSASIPGRVQCGLSAGEWRMFAWLEQEGFEYDLYSDMQLHDGTLDLAQYRVLILAVHPEYWSREMYQRTKDWVFNTGGRLMYLGGNGLNCEVVFDSTGAMTCRTHLASRRGEMGGWSEDGSVEYESRMHRTLESEANLLGVVCTDAGIMTSAPYKTIDSSHWVFEGTGLKNDELFGVNTLHERIPGGASGHETDKRSASSPANTALLAKGTNPDSGGSELVMIEHDHGGAVFSTGSITWVSALFTDAAVATITRNVLTRFSRS